METWTIARLVGRLPTVAEIVAPDFPVSGTMVILLGLLPLLTLGVLVSALHMARIFIPRERQGLR
jgi:hypothetical protein